MYGGADYSQFAPPKSYINALDYGGPKDLAKYLIELSRNTTEYKKYFDWKKRYSIVNSNRRAVCDLCKVLNENRKQSYVISKWYNASTCPLQRRLDEQVSPGGSGRSWNIKRG